LVAKQYDENKMGVLRERFENVVLAWPGATMKRMFGSPGYLAGGRMFAFLVTGAVVIMRLNESEREKLTERHEAEPFESGKTTLKWMRVPVESPLDLERIEPFVRASYERALSNE
jgi:TfoX/Sxy family transcriptional regulator of competence genes